MGTGISGNYYTSHGSNRVHHGALIHSFDGRFTRNQKTGRLNKLQSGGHGQTAIDIMDREGVGYTIQKTFKNGVRTGYLEKNKSRLKRNPYGMAWFPTNWTQRDMVRAGEHIGKLKRNRGVPDGKTIWGTYKGIRIGVIKTNGQIATIFPDSHYQPNPKKGK